MTSPEILDLLVIGGGVNGAGIARDAAGRGLSVVLVEKDDLAQGTSSRSGKLVHGGLRYLEYYEFRLVREALIEREVLLASAPHIIWPMRFVLPHSPNDRPAWLVRLGLFLYDHLGGRKRLPGTRTLADVLVRAIEYAEGGYVVSPRVGYDWAKLTEKLSAHPGARQHLLPGGRPPKVGEIVRFPELGKTLRAIAEKGRDAFYTGEIAADMVAELRELGGLHTVEDFAAQKATYVDPISVKYRGAELYEMPPNNQGIVALIMLRILDKLGTLGTDPLSVERYHVMTEASRLAYAIRDEFVADPVMANVPVEHMLSDATINDLASRIDRKKRSDFGPLPQPSGTDTIYMTVVDGSGMAVSFINSLFSPFGSGIVTRKTGITLQNRGQGFVLDPKHCNCIAPGKRPMHTLVPAIAFKNGKPWMSFGVMGANFQPMGHTYVMTNILDYGMDAQEALDHPRAFFEDGTLGLEKSMPKAVYEGLAAAGHPVSWREDPWGGGQIEQIDPETGVRIGASDARKDGMAAGY